MEDGEIADSDEESLTAAGCPAPGMGARVPGASAFQPRERVHVARPQPEQQRRLTARPQSKRAASSGSSSESELSDKDSDADGVPTNTLPRDARVHCLPTSSAAEPGRLAARRVNNVWGSVLAEQSLTQELTDVGVVRKLVSNERSVESYDYRRATRLRSSSADGSASADSDTELSDSASTAADGRSTSGSSCRSSDGGFRRDKATARSADLPLRISAKERLGKAVENVTSVTTDSPPEAVACYIATSLQEPKCTLISRVVDVLGTEKALRLFHQTRDIEDAGGIMTMDGSRRRTPGGVFILLMKKEVTKEQERQIFAVEMQLEKEKEKLKRKRARERVMGAKKARVDTAEAPMPVADAGDTPMPEAVPADDAALLASDPDFSLE